MIDVEPRTAGEALRWVRARARELDIPATTHPDQVTRLLAHQWAPDGPRPEPTRLARLSRASRLVLDSIGAPR